METGLGEVETGQRRPLHGKEEDHPHPLRKFFRTKMTSEIQVDIVEALMGHSEYLTEVYRQCIKEDLERFYREAEDTVLVFTSSERLEENKA